MEGRYSIFSSYNNENNAWTKAPADVLTILTDLGFEHRFLHRIPANESSILVRIWSRVKWELDKIYNLLVIPSGSVVVLQYPYSLMNTAVPVSVMLLLKLRHVRPILFIHDLPDHGQSCVESGCVLPRRSRWMRQCAAIISHNQLMTKALIRSGIAARRIVDLGIFDYLMPERLDFAKKKFCSSIVIAGNLNVTKAGYLQQLWSIKGVDWELYGGPFDSEKIVGETVHYHGSMAPDDLVKFLTGGFGLVWDGPSADTCEGIWGAYLKLNNPHKMSLYLSCGLPVIIWTGAAQSKFVVERKVGIAVDSLREIPNRLAGLSEKEYCSMCLHAKELSEELISGMFTKTALQKALELHG